MGTVAPTIDRVLPPPGGIIRRTVVVADMLSYGFIAKILEENLGAAAVADLNRQIQSFMNRSLTEIDSDNYCVVSRPGDGIILLFVNPEDAHGFAQRVHLFAYEHTQGRTEITAQRWFRIGIATGDVHATDCESGGHPEYAGMAIANAVRLETAADPGETIVDRPTFQALSPESQSLYPAETIVKGKRTETFPARRYPVTHREPDSVLAPPRRITRRTALISGTATIAAAATGITLWKRGHSSTPPMGALPSDRKVMVMPWPAPSPANAPFLASIVDAIQSRLSRAESSVKGLLLISPQDPGLDRTALPADQTTITPKVMADLSGANLILSTVVLVEKAASYLQLTVFNADTESSIRQDSVLIDSMAPEATIRRTTEKAAHLLDLPPSEIEMSDTAELARLPPAVHAIFDEAKYLARDENGIKDPEAIAKLNEVSKADPAFALPYAELGHLFISQYYKTREKSALEMADMNLTRALDLNPGSERAQLGKAVWFLANGQPMLALTRLTNILKADPLNDEAILHKAEAYKQLSNVEGQNKRLEYHLAVEQTYRELIRIRPDYWPAYNDLGQALNSHGKSDEAIHYFELASAAAPRAVIPLINRGTKCVEAGQSEKAAALFSQAIEIAPTASATATAYENLGTIHFEKKDYKGAIDVYLKGLKVSPKDDYLLSALGDCHQFLGQPAKVLEYYSQAAQIVSDALKINPNSGSKWMTLALYHAKIGQFAAAESDIQTAESHGATDVDSVFAKARALAQMGKMDQATPLVTYCLAHGKTPTDVDLSPELAPLIRKPFNPQTKS